MRAVCTSPRPPISAQRLSHHPTRSSFARLTSVQHTGAYGTRAIGCGGTRIAGRTPKSRAGSSTRWWIMTLALRENAFAAPVVKHQEDRQQTVIDSGVYAVVRHPMYAGGVLLLVGMPLWLESYPAAMLASGPIGMLVVRIPVEEQLLRRELAGYDAYTARARYRLIPFLW
jgi:Phospholipid methyltransferase